MPNAIQLLVPVPGPGLVLHKLLILVPTSCQHIHMYAYVHPLLEVSILYSRPVGCWGGFFWLVVFFVGGWWFVVCFRPPPAPNPGCLLNSSSRIHDHSVQLAS